MDAYSRVHLRRGHHDSYRDNFGFWYRRDVDGFMSFVHLHVHTDYSMLDGAGTVAGLASAARRMGMGALAQTDHGNMYGAAAFREACLSEGIKPILGVEAYVAPGPRSIRAKSKWGELEGKESPGSYTHLTLLAESAEGLRNLFHLHGESHLSGFYYKPRIDLELLETHSRGLIVLTGCAGSELSTRLRLGHTREAAEYAGRLKDIFGDRLYVEVMYHDITGSFDEKELLRLQIDFAASQGIPLVATNDAHYAEAGHADTHDALLCLQTYAKLQDEKRFRFNGSGYHLRSYQEMCSLGLPDEALRNTLVVAERVGNYDEVFKKRDLMPRAAGNLRDMCYESTRINWTPVYHDRLNYELSVINTCGFSDYFLVLADIVGWAKKNGIRVGPGRGSAGGSLVAYALGITDIDPIKYGLHFERFLNPDRVSPPDIDVDVPDVDRPKLIEYMKLTYGEDKVAQIITLGTIGAKAALHDATRVLGLQRSVSNRMVAGLPKALFGVQPNLTQLLDRDPKSVYDLACGLEGLIRQPGVHASGIIVSPEPLREHIPVWLNKGQLTTGFEQKYLEDLGFVKYDILGLKNLRIIDDCTRMRLRRERDGLDPMRPSQGTEVQLSSVVGPIRRPLSDLSDPATFELLSSGNTLGVFQLDSEGMQRLLRDVNPGHIEDLAAIIALYRPGPMGANAHRAYATAKRNGLRTPSIHPELDSPLTPILSETYGQVVYQEQIMEIAREVAGYSLAQADLLRKAMGKKNHEVLEREREVFASGMRSRGYSESAIRTLWGILVPFADYAFNKSHSVGYALVSYETAYLKTHHPREFMAALLTAEDDADERQKYLLEVARMGIPVLPPEVNTSDKGFTPIQSGIRYGISSIRGCAEAATSALVSRRPYRGLDDFFSRADKKVLNIGVVRALVRSGALDSLCPHREGLDADLETVVGIALEDRSNAANGQSTLYSKRITVRELPINVELRQRWEMELLGTHLSYPPIELRITSPLTTEEWFYARKCIESHPGQRPLSLRFRELNLEPRGCTVSESVIKELKALGKVE